MRTNNKLLYVFALLVGFFLMGCDDEGEMPVDPEGGQQVEKPEDGEGEATSPMYFPPAGTDEWATASAVELGWDTTSLADAIQYAKEKNSYSLLIIHKGRMIVEEYWKETNMMSQHDLESVSKSLMAFVIGVLQQDGHLSIDEKVSTYLGEGWSNAPASEADITIFQLLTMTSGLNEDLKYVGPPGETWRYSHAAYRRLYNVIEAATGSSFKDVFDSILFSPTGMVNHSWSGKDLLTNSRDIARFGLMILNNGTWEGTKLIQDEGYFKDMLSTSQSLQEAYGYLWWLNGKNTWYDDDNIITNEGPIASTMPSDAVLAKGKHDQRIYVVPSLDLVVIRQGGTTLLPEIGEGSFDVEFWARLMKAMGASS